MAAYTASGDTEWMPGVFAGGPDAAFDGASTARIMRDGQAVGDLAVLYLVSGVLRPAVGSGSSRTWVAADPQALMLDAVLTDEDYEMRLPEDAADWSVIGSTLVAFVHPSSSLLCTWLQDGALVVFRATDGGRAQDNQFLQDHLGQTQVRSSGCVPTLERAWESPCWRLDVRPSAPPCASG